MNWKGGSKNEPILNLLVILYYLKYSVVTSFAIVVVLNINDAQVYRQGGNEGIGKLHDFWFIFFVGRYGPRSVLSYKLNTKSCALLDHVFCVM